MSNPLLTYLLTHNVKARDPVGSKNPLYASNVRNSEEEIQKFDLPQTFLKFRFPGPTLNISVCTLL